MSEIIIKKPKRKIKHPTDDPMYKKRQTIAEKNIKEGKLPFNSELERKDYERRVNANPNNVFGYPALYPPQTLSSSLIGVNVSRSCECGGCCIAIDNYICPRCGKDNAL